MWGVEPPTPEPWLDRSIRATTSDNPFDFVEVAPLPDVAVSAAAIRLPLGAFLDDWVKNNRAVGRAAVAAGADAEAVAGAMEQYAGPKKKGRAPLPDGLLERVAHFYVEAIEDGERAPAKAVARGLAGEGHKGLHLPTVRSWITRARQRGYIPEETRRYPSSTEETPS